MGNEIADRWPKAAADEAEAMSKEDQMIAAVDILRQLQKNILSGKMAVAVGSDWFWDVFV